MSPIAWSIGSLYATHRAALPHHPLVATGSQMVAGAAVLAVMSLATGEPGRFDAGGVSTESLAAFLYLTVVGSLLAFTTFGWMLRVAPLPLVATYAYVNPVVAVILGALVLGEPIEPRTLVAGAVIVAAVALIVTARGRMASPRAAARVTTPPGPSEPRGAPSAITVSIGLTPSAVGNSDASATYRPATIAPRRPRAANAAVRIARVVARRRAHPDRAHLVGREDRAAVRARSPSRATRSSNRPNARSVGAGRAADRMEADRRRRRRRRSRRPRPARARRAIRTAAWRSVAHPDVVEPVVDADPPGRGQRDPALARRRA